MPTNRRDNLGFTIIELLVVIAIIAVLAALAASQFSSYKRNAFDARIKSDLRNGASAEEAVFSDTTLYVSCGDAAACAAALPGVPAFSDQTIIAFTATNPNIAFTGEVSCIGCSQSYTWDSESGGLQP